ncbi:MAG: GatB/YqeY domain-containing protein [bacterium]
MAKGELANKLQHDVVAAMKGRDKERLGVLRMLQAAVKQVEVDQREELQDDGVVQVLSSYARKVKDQITSYRDGDRQDLLARAEKEMAIVSEFLPAELTDAELEDIVRATIVEIGARSPRDMGNVMKAVMPKVAGRAAGGRISGLVKRLLQN